MISPSAPVVCGHDFSPDSARALRCAATVAARLGRRLHIVSAIEPLLAEAAKVQRQSADFLEQVTRELRGQASGLSLPKDALTFHVEAGEPAAVLMRAADQAEASLVVVGTRGLGRAARLFLGSTTLRLLRATTRPVLAVPAPDDASEGGPAEWPAVRRIVCGVDFSEGAMAAASAAAELSAALGAGLTLVHAVAPIAVPLVWEDLVRATDEERVSEAIDRLRELATTLGRATDVRARMGAAVDVLSDEAGQDESVVIAVGLRGASHHRPGSTALRIVSTAKVPVLAVPV